MRVLVGITGSIAAYKGAELVRGLVKRGDEVKVVMTRAATMFVSELTFQTLSRNKVYCEEFEAQKEWEPKHIALAAWAEKIVIAPATANTIAKIRFGLADNLLSGIVLATSAPILIAPAMNCGMWENEATRENIEVLRKRGIEIIEPSEGELACAANGKGRLADIPEILKKI